MKHNNTLNVDYYNVKEAGNVLDYIISNNDIKFCYSKKSKCLDITCVFDIEASSFKDGKNKVALMYIWMFTIYSDKTGEYFTFVGRTWQEYLDLLHIIYKKFGIEQRNKNYFSTNGRRVKCDLRKKYTKKNKDGISEFDIDKQYDRLTPLYIKETQEYQDSLTNAHVEVFYKKWLEETRGYYIPIFVHNLSYEMSYLRPIFSEEMHDVFAPKPNSPLYFRTTGFEYRCSYLLSGVKLEHLPTKKWHKQTGKLDYSLIRTPKTPLSDEEMSYCIGDTLTLAEYITFMRKRDGDITKMEYTKTGYVRRGMRRYCLGEGKTDKDYYKKLDYLKLVAPLKFRSTKEYLIQKNAFQGGHTAASAWYCGQVVKNVTCIDFCSAYPAIICSYDRFPLSPYKYVEEMTAEEYDDLRKKGYAIVSRIKFKNLKSKLTFDSPIIASNVLDRYYIDNGEKIYTIKIDGKEERIPMLLNNGKVAGFKYRDKDSYLVIAGTELDMDIYKAFYEYDEVVYNNCYVYNTGRLPKVVIEYTLQRYVEKTKLKGDIGKEVFYNLSKELLNSIYGAMVQDCCKMRPILDIESGMWKKHNLWLSDNTHDELQELIDKYNDKISMGCVPTPYIWGVYVASAARWNLFSGGLLNAGKLGYWVYADTDSLYIKDFDKWLKETTINGENYIDWYNNRMIKKLNAMCDFYGFDYSIYKPKNNKGEEKIIGLWERQKTYKLFKTLGAKRYCVLTEDNEFIVTVSGLDKNKGSEWLAKTYGIGYYTKTDKDGIHHYVENEGTIFKEFSDNLEIPEEGSGRYSHRLITTKKEGTVIDYLGKEYKYSCLGGTYIEPAKYSMSVEQVYLDYLFGVQEGGI